MIINKFKLFESLSIGAIERGEHLSSILNESEKMDEGIFSSISNFFSRMLGGSVSKLDKILRKYKDNEIEYWTNWADARGRFGEADALSKEAKADPVEKMKYEEQKERVKKLQSQVEEKRKNVNDALLRQASGIIKDSERLKDYWEMKKAVIDEEAAKASFEEIKKSTDNDTIHDLFDTEIQRAVKAARKKNELFKEKYGELSSGKFFEQPAQDEDLTVSGIKIKDLMSKTLADIQQNLKNLHTERLDDLVKYLEKELKKIKDQRDDEIKNIKNSVQDKTQSSKQSDDISKKYKSNLDNIQSKIDYIDQLILSSKGLKQEIKSNPEIVTDVTKKELGVQGTDKALDKAIDKTAEVVKKPTAESVDNTINDQVKKNFQSAKETIEEAVEDKISDQHYEHLKNDMISLYGKLVFYYKNLNSNVPSKNLEFGIIDFAAGLYTYKKEHNLLGKDLSQKEIEKQFELYSK